MVLLISDERALLLYLDIDITTGTGELVLRVFDNSKVNGQEEEEEEENSCRHYLET